MKLFWKSKLERKAAEVVRYRPKEAVVTLYPELSSRDATGAEHMPNWEERASYLASVMDAYGYRLVDRRNWILARVLRFELKAEYSIDE